MRFTGLEFIVFFFSFCGFVSLGRIFFFKFRLVGFIVRGWLRGRIIGAKL